MSQIDFTAPPTIAKFMKSEAFGRIAAGPVGSGKTTACIIELLRRAAEQDAAPDGLSYTRFAIVRQTLKQLKDTVLKECQAWLSQVGGYWKVSENTYHLSFDNVRSEWIFIPLEDADDQGRLLSMQLTGTWLSEAIEMNLDIIAPLSGRIGRYPSGNRGVPTWAGLIADTNMPTEMTPWHTFMENMPMDWQKFVQPSGLSDEAENLNFLLQTKETMKLPLNHPDRIAQGRKYYQRLVDMYGIDSTWIKRYVKAEYGDDPSGMAVFKESFRTDFHVVDDTLMIPSYPLLIGQDFGRNPWSLICQVDHMGRLLVHQEVRATNMGLEKHINQNLRPMMMSERFMGARFAIVGDPAGVAKGTITEESNFDALRRLGLPGIPAPTNDIDPRLRAVEALLSRQTNGGPTLMISRRGCPHLVRAMAGGYRFTKMKSGALRVTPDKNDAEGFSHVVDCLQYVCLCVHGGMMPYISDVISPRMREPRPPMPAMAWT